MPRRHHLASSLGIELPSPLLADPRPWHAVVMSRLGRSPLAHRLHLSTLYRWTEQALARGDAPLAVIGTAAHRWVTRACELLNQPAVQLALQGDPAVRGWCAAAEPQGHAGVLTAAHDPTAHDPAADHPVVHLVRAAPPLCRDALAIMAADRVDVAYVRRGGAIERLLRARLAADDSPAVRVLVPVPAAAAPRTAAVLPELIAAGAIGYCYRAAGTPEANSDFPAVRSGVDDTERAMLAAALQALLQRPQDWLIHWTRGRRGPWPGQSDQQFCDGLLLAAENEADPSPLGTLQRIVRQRQLVGTCRTVGGDQPVVCLSALPLLAIAAARVFRSHLGRWDAEPYGVAIGRQAAGRLGAQPVCYIDTPRRQATSQQQVAGQPAVPRWRLQGRGRTFDWTAEQEWRVRGSLDLRQLAADEVIVFVDREEERMRLGASRWPVISVQALRQAAGDPQVAGDGVAKDRPVG